MLPRLFLHMMVKLIARAIVKHFVVNSTCSKGEWRMTEKTENLKRAQQEKSTVKQQENTKKGYKAATKQKFDECNKVSKEKTEKMFKPQKKQSIIHNSEKPKRTTQTADMLSKEELLFCASYLKSYNAENAARYAGYDKSECLEKGYELLQSEKVKKHIRKIKKKQQSSMFADGSEVLQKYMDIAFADIFDFVSLSSVPITAEDIENSPAGIFIKTCDKIQVFLPDVVSGSLIAEIRQSKDGVTIKFSDRLKALEWLTAYHELNPADVHKREAERRKISIAAARLCTQSTEEEDELQAKNSDTVTADNYNEALQNTGAFEWEDDD